MGGYCWRGTTHSPPANTTLCHLRMPSYHEDTQDDPNKLEFWLGLNWSSHPHLAKWLVLHKAKEEWSSGVVLAVLPFPAWFPIILSIFDQR